MGVSNTSSGVDFPCVQRLGLGGTPKNMSASIISNPFNLRIIAGDDVLAAAAAPSGEQ